jgi:excisionase family DNA binding protein
VAATDPEDSLALELRFRLITQRRSHPSGLLLWQLGSPVHLLRGLSRGSEFDVGESSSSSPQGTAPGRGIDLRLASTATMRVSDPEGGNPGRRARRCRVGLFTSGSGAPRRVLHPIGEFQQLVGHPTLDAQPRRPTSRTPGRACQTTGAARSLAVACRNIAGGAQPLRPLRQRCYAGHDVLAAGCGCVLRPGAAHLLVVTDADRSLTVSVDEAALLLGISRGLAYRLVDAGVIPSVRLGRRIVVPRKQLDQMLDQPERAG